MFIHRLAMQGSGGSEASLGVVGPLTNVHVRGVMMGTRSESTGPSGHPPAGPDGRGGVEEAKHHPHNKGYKKGGGKSAGGVPPVASTTLVPPEDAAWALGLQPFTLRMGCDVRLPKSLIDEASNLGNLVSMSLASSSIGDMGDAAVKRMRLEGPPEGDTVGSRGCSTTPPKRQLQPETAPDGSFNNIDRVMMEERLLVVLLRYFRRLMGLEVFLEGRFILAGSFRGELVPALGKLIDATSSGGRTETSVPDGEASAWDLRCSWESRDEHVASACFTAINGAAGCS